MEINFKMEINQQQISLPFTSSGDDEDDSVNQSAAADDVSFGDDNNNQQLKPDGFVNPLADDDDVSTGFNRVKPEGSVNPSAGDDVSFGFKNVKSEGSVNQSADNDVSFGFNHLKPEGSDDQLEDDDVSTGFNSLKSEYSVNPSANDDVSTGYSQSQELMLESSETDVEDEEDDVSTGFNHLKPDGSVYQPANHDVSFNHDSVAQSAADDVSFVDDSVNHSAADDDVISGDDISQHVKPHDSGDQAKPDDVSFGFNNLQINANDDNSEDDDDVEGDFTFAVGDTDSFKDYETGEIRTVYPLFDQSLLSGDNYNDGKLKLPIEVPVNKIYIESPSNKEEPHGMVYALSDGMGSGSPEMKMKSNSTGFSKLWRFRKEMNRSNSDSRDAFVFFENSNRAGKSMEKVNITGRSTEKVNVAGGKGKAVRKDLNSKKVVASAHEVYLKQKAGQPEEERRRSYLPYRPGLMGFFTNVNGGLSKNVHPF